MDTPNDRESELANSDDLDILLQHGFGKSDRIPGVNSLWPSGEGCALVGPAQVAADLPPDLASGDAPGESLLGRYQIFGEFARGGVGVLFRARDHVLRRDVAIKVLLSRHKDRPELHRRFLEEAQICAQLQHPGIVPLYDAGRTEDGRPFLAMKLIQGATLSARLAARKDSAQQRHELVRVLGQVCQAIAYAHARGVIHRDLKPGNVMVGAFGEVQVMDFGMAKVLAREDDARGKDQGEATASPITTIRSDDPSSASVGGSVMGTYAYMSPEQASGDVALVDARSDVFGLGAILCEILTGSAPYRGDGENLRLKAAACDLGDADARLQSSGADHDLVELCKRCLSPSRSDRPKDAGALADQLGAYLASFEERALAAQMAVVRAEEQVLAERTRRRLQVALLLTLLVLAAVGAGGWAYFKSERGARVARTAQAVDRTIAAAREKRPDGTDESSESMAGWAAAIAGARQAVELSRGPDADEATRMRAAAFLAEMEETERRMQEQRKQSAKDARMCAQLIDIHGRLMNTWLGEERGYSDRLYAAAYKEYGLDVENQSEAEIADAIRRSGISADIRIGLDRWVLCKAMAIPADVAGMERIREILRIADPDPLRRRIRAALMKKDRELALQLAQEVDRSGIQPVSAVQLAWALWNAGAEEESVQLCRDVAVQNPGDFSINFQAGTQISGLGDVADKARYLSAALASRPDSLAAANDLALALTEMGEHDEAIQVLKRIVSIHPRANVVRLNLGITYENSGRMAEALESYRTALVLEPQDPRIHEKIARVLKRSGRLEEARETYYRALETWPDDAGLLRSYGEMLSDQLNDTQGAVEVFEKVVGINPEDLTGWRNLAIARNKLGDSNGCLEAFRKLLELDPRSAFALGCIGQVLFEQGRFEEARKSLEAGLAIEPENAGLCTLLVATLDRLGEVDEALTVARKACSLDPKLSQAWFNLGELLARREDWKGAQEAFAKLIELRPEDAENHFQLGRCLLHNGDKQGATTLFRKALELQPDRSDIREALEQAERSDG